MCSLPPCSHVSVDISLLPRGHSSPRGRQGTKSVVLSVCVHLHFGILCNSEPKSVGKDLSVVWSMQNAGLRAWGSRCGLHTEDTLLSPHFLELHTSEGGEERRKEWAGRSFLECAGRQHSLPLTLTPQVNSVCPQRSNVLSYLKSTGGFFPLVLH